MEKHRLDKDGKAFKSGNEAEILFKKLMESKGYLVEETSKKDQFANKGDFVCTKDGKEEWYEIKGRKRINRQDSEFNDKLVWIELQKVNGNPGALYGSFSKFAFQFTENAFIIVGRDELQKLVESKLQNIKVTHASDALYKLYQRWQRNDLLSLIKFSDLLSLSHTILNP